MKEIFLWVAAFLAIVLAMFAQGQSPSPASADFDVIIRNGTVYDGTGAEPQQADVAIRGDRIVGVIVPGMLIASCQTASTMLR